MGISTAPLARPEVAVSLNAIKLPSTPHGAGSPPAMAAQPDGTATESQTQPRVCLGPFKQL